MQSIKSLLGPRSSLSERLWITWTSCTVNKLEPLAPWVARVISAQTFASICDDGVVGVNI